MPLSEEQKEKCMLIDIWQKASDYLQAKKNYGFCHEFKRSIDDFEQDLKEAVDKYEAI